MTIPPTSRFAAASIIGVAANLRDQVHAFLIGRGLQGATAQEVEQALGLSGNTVRPRLVELRKSKRIITLGELRPTSAGRQAVVWLTTAVVRSARVPAPGSHQEGRSGLKPSSDPINHPLSSCEPAKPSN